MPVYKTEKNGTWYAMVRYKDWKGERKQKCQRGFATKREAQEWERQFQLQKQANMDVTLESFCKLYEADVRPRLKENTYISFLECSPDVTKPPSCLNFHSKKSVPLDCE